MECGGAGVLVLTLVGRDAFYNQFVGQLHAYTRAAVQPQTFGCEVPCRSFQRTRALIHVESLPCIFWATRNVARDSQNTKCGKKMIKSSRKYRGNVFIRSNIRKYL